MVKLVSGDGDDGSSTLKCLTVVFVFYFSSGFIEEGEGESCDELPML